MLHLIDVLRERVEAARAKLTVLVRGEPPPPPAQSARSSRLLAARPAPPPKEPRLSPRRLLIALEAILLGVACWRFGSAGRELLGGWPSRANFVPPRIRSFGAVRGLAVKGRNVWVISPGQLTLVRTGKRIRTFQRLKRRLPSPVVTAVAPDGDGGWIGTAKGLARHDGKALRRIAGAGPVRAHVTCLALDGEGRLWVGTAKDGLFVHMAGTWRQFKQELASPYVTALAAAGGKAVWVGLYSGGVVRTDGAGWAGGREPERARGKPVRRLIPLPGDRVLALTDRGAWEIAAGTWAPWRPEGRARGEAYVDGVSVGASRLVLLAGDGTVLAADASGGTSARSVAPALPATALAADGRVAYFGSGERVWRLRGESIDPLTNWGEFFDPHGWFPPPPDVPSDWADPRWRAVAGRMGAAALLLAAALFVRSHRWRVTHARHAWRTGPLRQAAVVSAALGVYFLMQKLGWRGRPFVATTAHQVLLPPLTVAVAGWTGLHWLRMIRYEWKERADAFWSGTAMTLSAAGAWIWWVHGALVPSLLVCAAGGMTFSRSLKGLRMGTWRGASLAWGVAVMVFQQAALLPPLLFAVSAWGRAALYMGPTSPLVTGLPKLPERFAWAGSGLAGAYVTREPSGASLELLDASGETWEVRRARLPFPDVAPRFAPDSRRLAVCYPVGADTFVECFGMDGARLWKSRIPGRPAPGRQPCWEAGGEAMVVLSAAGGRTTVWRVQAATGDATRLLEVPRPLAWPSLVPGRGKLFAATVGRQGSRLAAVDLTELRVAGIQPVPDPRRPLVVFSPSREGKAVLAFLVRARGAARRSLEAFRRGLERVAGLFGYRTRLPEFWIRKPWRDPGPPPSAFRWEDIEAVREVEAALNGRELACIVRRGDGEEHLLYMRTDGSGLRIVHRTGGLLHSLRWAPFKNRLAVVEERLSALSPHPVRSLLLVEGLPEAPVVNAYVPFAQWLDSPEFSSDGQRLTYAAPDRFWRVGLAPPESFGVFEVAMESEVGILPPPKAASGVEAQTPAPATTGGH